MAGHLILHRPGRPPERVAVVEALAAGGGPNDAVRLEGAPQGALALEPSPAGVVAEARAPGVRVDGRPFDLGSRRLVRPGEAVAILDCRLEVPAEAAREGTRGLAAALIDDAVQGRLPVTGPHLLVLDGREAGRRIPLGSSQTLGRGRAAAIRIDDPRASRLHARLVVDGGRVRLEDLGSKNGVRLNGAAAGPGPVAIRPGDEISLGETSLALVEPSAEVVAPPGPRRAPAARVLEAWSALAAVACLLALCAAALALVAG